MFLLVFLEDGMAAAWREILKRVISRMKNFPPLSIAMEYIVRSMVG
jgi:hypothetical protein